MKRRYSCKHNPAIRARDCKECHATWQRRWRQDNQELANRRSRECKWREQGIKITYAEYEAMLSAQGGVCAICLFPPMGKRKTVSAVLNVDHNHATGKPRALLCSSCNAMLGLSGDSPDRLRLGAEYLLKHMES